MIRALPPDLRRQYEALRVETVVFYPKAFVADSWQELGALRDTLSTGAAFDWAQALDLRARTRTTVDDLDEQYACLRYPVRNLAAKLVELRKRAKTAEPAGPLDKAYKLTANTLYGRSGSAGGCSTSARRTTTTGRRPPSSRSNF